MAGNNNLLQKMGASFMPQIEKENTAKSPYETYIVKEFYTDPIDLQTAVRDLIKQKVSNPEYVDDMPINSIIAYDAELEKSKTRVLYPFFPQHLCLPIKPGEQVWAFAEGNLYYWVARKTAKYRVDDVNYTHIDRTNNIPLKAERVSAIESYKSGLLASDIPAPTQFPEGTTDNIANKTLGFTASYANIIGQSEAYQRNFQPESVPRITRNPGDLVLQGSNNSSISLSTSGKKSLSGTVDIVAGRNINPNSVTTSDRGSEINKSQPASQDTDIDQRFNQDLSRIYLTMGGNNDSDFNIEINGVGESGYAPGVVLKSNQVRIVARDDIKISVGEKGAGIVLKSDGNIVIVPSSDGVIKLGGEDASNALLCQPATNAPNPGGSVVGTPITLPSGGAIGIGSGTGVFASKILVK